MSDPVDGPTGPATVGDGAHEQRLDHLREQVEMVDGLPVADRVVVFEQVNDGIAAELARLDEV